MLYADGRADQARALLEQLLETARGCPDPRPWRLLFTLSRCAGDWQRFESLGSRYERVCDRPAPQWLSEEELADLPAEMREGGSAHVALPGALDARSAAALRALRACANEHDSLHLDASKVSGLDQDGCAELSAALRFLGEQGTRLLITGVSRLIRLLKEALVALPAANGYWMALLDLYQYQDMQGEFERTALEYALATGAKPPEWQQAVAPRFHRSHVREKRDEPRYQSGPEVAYLQGIVTSPADPQLTALLRFAQSRQYVNVNLVDLTRIAPAAASELVTAASRLAAEGKVVRLLRPNALVETLLEALHPDPRVQLIRAQSL